MLRAFNQQVCIKSQSFFKQQLPIIVFGNVWNISFVSFILSQTSFFFRAQLNAKHGKKRLVQVGQTTNRGIAQEARISELSNGDNDGF